MRTTLLMLALSATCPAATLVLTPSGVASVAAGDVTGWGYALTATDVYAVPTFSEFNPAPDNGLYVDFVPLPANFVVVAPFTTGGQDFDPVQHTGIGELFVDPSTPAGTIINGTITLHYDLYLLDPNVDPNSFLSGDNVISSDASVSVAALAVASPEPATFGLIAGSLALAMLGKRGYGQRW